MRIRTFLIGVWVGCLVGWAPLVESLKKDLAAELNAVSSMTTVFQQLYKILTAKAKIIKDADFRFKFRTLLVNLEGVLEKAFSSAIGCTFQFADKSAGDVGHEVALRAKDLQHIANSINKESVAAAKRGEDPFRQLFSGLSEIIQILKLAIQAQEQASNEPYTPCDAKSRESLHSSQDKLAEASLETITAFD